MSTIDSNLSALDGLGVSSRQEPQPTNELGQEDFLELMLAQLQNQDPLEPMDDADFIAQLAQFSTASGIQDLQGSATQLLGSLQSSQALQASTLVGRSVLVPSNVATLPEGGSLQGQVDLETSTPELRVGVYDSTGQLVRVMNLGTQAAGQVSFAWDGLSDTGEQLPAGDYGIRAEALVDGEAVAMDTLVAAHVESVTLGRNGQSTTLNLEGRGSIDFSQVREVM